MSDIEFDEGQPLKPIYKILLWVCVVVFGIAILLLFSGRMVNLHKQEAKAQPVSVQHDSNIAPLTYPKIDQPAAPQPHAPQNPQPHAPNGFGGFVKDERQAALDSDISAYSVRGGGGGGSSEAQTRELQRNDAGGPDALEASLKPTTMEGVRVAELPNPRWLIEEGRILPCSQISRINSTLPGAVSAIIPEEIRGETGDTVLLDKGAKVFGTIRSTLMNGADRLAVLWQDITSPVLYDTSGMPHQFRVAANSPASSQLGETGLDGDINRHLGIKIGGILGMSLVQGGTQYLVQSAQKSNTSQTNLNFMQQGGDSAANELLRAWVQIPDVLTRNQGMACGIQIVRDLDMRGAYKLRQTYKVYR